METDQEQQKHQCKICCKSFSSGRSLGGHMRSHIHSRTSDAEEKQKFEGSRGQAGLGLGYDLRENPKKTFRLSDFVDEDLTLSSKQCKECGKEFPSWKSLFGHMRCHSERTCPQSFDDEEEGSWGVKDSLANLSGDNEPPPFPLPAVPKRKRRSKRVSLVSLTGYEPEQEDVAISLMMLSRDMGEFSDKNSEEEFSGDELRRRRSILSSALLGEKRTMFVDNRFTFNGFNVLERRYKCLTCNKGFDSYHALGGHRANHKRMKNCSTENASFDTEVIDQKSRIHECDICGKVFSSGQALGGHKRSHLVSNIGGRGGAGEFQSIMVQQQAEISEQFDLNLPAPVDMLSSNLKVWWSGMTL